MTDEPSTYVPVGQRSPEQQPRRPRWWRRLHRYRWWRLTRAVATVLLWAAGTVGITWWWARRPETGVGDVVWMAVMAAALLGAGLIPKGTK